MPEIGTAWITLAVSAKGAQNDIKRALLNVDADSAGRKAGKDFSRGATSSANLTGLERKLAQAGQRGAAAVGKALKAGLVAAGAAGAAAIGTSLKLGFDRLRAIDDAKAKLRGLGNDAATVQQVMDNALAAVQGTAFGLGDAAGLAGVIVASGIKPGQDLETVLKRVADSAAISGSSLSDMGQIWAKTAAKGRLDGEILAQLLERQIPIYDILSKKLGVSAEEVADMVKKGKVDFQTFSDAMNDRVAGAALRTGETVKGSFDNMKAAMGRLGAAALEPSFNRLPATFTRITTAIDEATPRAKELAKQFDAKVFSEWVPAAQAAFTQLQQGLQSAPVRTNIAELRAIFTSVADAAKSAWPAIQQIGKSLGEASKALGVSGWQLFITALEAAAGVLNALVGPLQALAGFMKDHQKLVTAAAAAWLAFRTVPALLARIGPGATSAATAVSTLGQRLSTARGGVSTFADAYRTNLTYLRQANPNISTAAAHISTLGNVSRSAAAGGLSMLRGAAGGLINALGGPFSAALIAAGAAIAIVSAKNQKASQSLKAYDDAVRRTAQAQVALNEALVASGGAYDSSVASAAAGRMSAYINELDTASARTGSFMDQFRMSDQMGAPGWLNETMAWMAVTNPALMGTHKAFDRFGVGESRDKEIKDQAAAAKDAQQAIDGLRMSNQSLADVVYGSQGAFDAMVRKLEAAGDGGRQAAAQMRQARAEFQMQQAAARTLTPGISQMADAMKVLSDSTASAADKTRALTAALDALNPARSLGEAIAAHDREIQQITESTQQAIDQTQGFGEALLSTSTGIDTSTRNGQALREALVGLVDASSAAVANGQSLGEVMAKNGPVLQQLADQYGLSIEQIQAAFNLLGGKDLELTMHLAGAPEAVQSLGLVGRAFAAVPDSKEVTLKTTEIESARGQLEGLGFTLQNLPNGTTRVIANTDDARARLGGIIGLLESGQIPENVPIAVSAPGGAAVADLLVSLGQAVSIDNEKRIHVEAPLGQEVLNLLASLGYAVTQNNDKTISVRQVGAEEAKRQIDEAAEDRHVNIFTSMGDAATRLAQRQQQQAPPRADGAIVPMANGGLALRHIIKPSDAGIYAGRGAGTIFAEQETGGEAYIPLAPGKRGRSTAILAEVARLFGLNVVAMEDGGITIDMLKAFASGISGHPYVWGGGAGDTFDTDCSGAQATIANYLTGATGRFSTADAMSALAARGFQTGDPPPGIAAYWVGWNAGHAAGTIVDPTGGNVNVEMGGRGGGGQYGGGAAGAADFPQRAWLAVASGDDPNAPGSSGTTAATQRATAAVTSARAGVTSAQAGVDSARQNVENLRATGASPEKIATAEKKVDAAEQRLTAAQQRLAIAENKLTEAQQENQTKSGSSSGGDGQSLGQSIISGMLQAIGLDGSLFSDPFQWPNVQSAMAGLNFGGNLIKSMMGGDGASVGGLNLGLPSVAGLITPGAAGATRPFDHKGAGGAGAGGPLVAYNGTVNMGVDPRAMTQRQNADMNQALRRNSVIRTP